MATQILPLEERLELARKAYKEYFGTCFWFMKPDFEIEERHLPVVAKYLSLHGGIDGWRLAARICPSRTYR